MEHKKTFNIKFYPIKKAVRVTLFLIQFITTTDTYIIIGAEVTGIIALLVALIRIREINLLCF